MTESSGANANAQETMIDAVVGGGITLHLVTSTIDHGDGDTEITAASDASEDVPSADLSVAPGSGFADTAEIVIDVEVDFGMPDIGPVEDVVAQSQDNGDDCYLLEEPNAPDLTGEEVTLPAGTTVYELGNP